MQHRLLFKNKYFRTKGKNKINDNISPTCTSGRGKNSYGITEWNI
jgi:hypothetical protein